MSAEILETAEPVQLYPGEVPIACPRLAELELPTVWPSRPDENSQGLVEL